jgi:hypothetical protein
VIGGPEPIIYCCRKTISMIQWQVFPGSGFSKYSNRGVYLMSNVDLDQQGAKAKNAPAEDEPVSRYEVVPYAEKTNDSDLYAFRTSLPAPPPAVPRPTPVQQAAAAQKKTLLMAGSGAAVLLLIILVAVIVATRQEPVPPFIDLGPNNVASAGLAARLIAKWDGTAEYELHIDPLVPSQIPGFSAVAAFPPQPLSFEIRLKSALGALLCQKEILIPVDRAGEADPENAQPLVPVKTVAGDFVQNVAGTDGLIDEIVVNGSLACSAKAYKRFAAWELASSFPSIAEQQTWRQHEQSVEANLRRKAAEARARALIPRTRPLAAPIDGDDVIVFDNPSKGTIETKAGRLFYVGRPGLRQRAPGWQVFPAAIHFHCDIKSNCVLTRSDAPTALSARLVE